MKSRATSNVCLHVLRVVRNYARMTTASDSAPITPWVPDVDSFGARLILVRHRMGWNMKEAALACGLPQASWRGWEVDGNRPRDLVDVCRKIAKRTGASYDWLLDGRVQAASGLSREDTRSDTGWYRTPATASTTSGPLGTLISFPTPATRSARLCQKVAAS